MSYLSRVQYTGTGSNALYSIPFAYISKAYVEVRVGGSLLAEGAGYTWQSATSILLSAGNLATGVVLDIRRATPKTSKLVDFQDGSVLTEASLDLSNDQVFQLVQENLDDMQDRIAVQPDGTIDSQGRRIKNVADPVNDQDAVTKVYADAGIPAMVASASSSAVSASTSATNASASNSAAAASATAAAASATAAAASAATAEANSGGVKVSAADTTASNLNAKLMVAGSLTKTIVNPGQNEQLRLDVVVPEEVPAGCVAYFARSSAPSGWLKANGALVSRTAYAALFASIGTTFGAGDGSTTFALPDLRGEFIRSVDDGRGVDTGRSLGSAQTDAMQGHKHDYSAIPSGGFGGGAGFNQSSNTTLQTGVPVTDGVNGTPRTGAETRPRNVALLACIKY